jgi:hypothetical protein
VATVPALVLISLLLGVLFIPPPAHAASWRWPLRGSVQERFDYTSATPFARGQHRGIIIWGPPRTPVHAACAGRVSFAGALPRCGAGVTVVCGALTASYLQLASLAVRRGDRVAVGDRLGRVGARGLHLGARRTGRRWGYVDPLSLLAGDPPARPVPLVRAPRWRIGPRPLGARPPAAPVLLRWSAPIAGAARPAVPVVAWLGLGLLAAALPALGLGRVRRRRREAARPGYAPPDAA